MQPTILFETKCYENDWIYLLKTNRLKRAIQLCNYTFDKKVLFINNVHNRSEVFKYADKLISKGILDEYIWVDEYADKCLEAFDIPKNSFSGGYYYSISELVSIYLAKTDYILHFSSDSIMIESQYNWITPSLKAMTENKNIVVANPTWNNRYEEAKSESFSEDDLFYYGYGFSDQCYLVKSEEFKNKIYNDYHPDSDRYPIYGGNLFEKRVDSYMRNNSKIRITSKYTSYMHKNFPKNPMVRYLARAFYSFKLI